MLTDRPMLSGGGRIVDRLEEALRQAILNGGRRAGEVAPAAAGR
jgi:hypothetical protein